MTVLVTGGAGFLGSHLCDRLVAAGNAVTCLDTMQTGSPANLRHLIGHPDFTLLVQDVAAPLEIRPARIFNLACPASPVQYAADPIGTMRTCVLGAMNMLDLARRTGARILQASTSEIYGDPEQHPQRETYWGNVNPIGPRACYDEGKRAAETLFFDYHRQHHVPIRVARIFNTYGPRMRPDDGRVVSNFIVQALAGRSLTIQGDGSQTRSFCYVDDLIDAMLLMMDGNHPGPINLGNPTECTVRELAELVLELTGSRSAIEHTPLPADDPRRRRPDISSARLILGWEPKIALRDGIAETIGYFRHTLAA